MSMTRNAKGDSMKKLLLVLCIFWIGVIFYLGTESSSISNGKSLMIVRSIKPYYEAVKKEILINGKSGISMPANKVDKKLNIYVRKTAHFTEYFILGLIVCSALFSIELKGKAGLGYILFICLFCGVIDEFNQSFINRTSLVSDILIDFTGSCFGVIGFYFFYYKFSFGYSNLFIKK
jgi:VanZ family protein